MSSVKLLFLSNNSRAQASQPPARIQIGMREFLVSAPRSRNLEKLARMALFQKKFTKPKTPGWDPRATFNVPSRLRAVGKKTKRHPLNAHPSELASRRVSAVRRAARSSIRAPLDPEAKRTDARESGSWEAELPPFRPQRTVR